MWTDMPEPSDWSAIARDADPDELREHILTGFKEGKPFTPYVPTVPLPAGLASVLDFGCGVGRNFPYLKTIARQIVGFDLPAMIERCRALAPGPADRLFDDWNEVKAQRFDLVVATLVLQHIDATLCRQYLSDFARLAPRAYVLSRAASDFDANVFAAIADSGVFDAGECIEVEHDPSTHQLRVLGRKRFEEVCRSGGSGHYEVLLRSRLQREP
jgi:SAM-dependent methyltransferase